MTEMTKTPPTKPRTMRRVATTVIVVFALALFGAWLAAPSISTRGGADVLIPVGPPAANTHLSAPEGFEAVVDRVKPAVFGIRAKIVDNTDDQAFLPRLGEQPGEPEELKPPGPITSQGSGFFISPDGYAVTANHVIAHGTSIEIETDDGKNYPAKLVGSDPQTDIALIKVDGGSGFGFVEIADQAPRIGEWVIAVGNPFGLGGTVTAGIVSARARDIDPSGYSDYIQIDAPVNQGNSGGPTFDVSGKVIGVNSAIVTPSGGSVGIGFAIPAETVKAVATELKDNGMVVRAWLGVLLQAITPEIAEGLDLKETQGALVTEPLPSTPAAKVGIRSGDVIAVLNGERLKDDRDLVKKIGKMAPGTRVEIGIVRQGKTETFELTLAQLPAPRSEVLASDEKAKTPGGSTDPSSLGVTLAPGKSLAPDAGGVVVTKVDPDGIAAERGLQPGDVILEVGGDSVSQPAEVNKALSDARGKSKRNVVARVRSGDATRFVAIPVG
jgi:serine protease Do